MSAPRCRRLLNITAARISALSPLRTQHPSTLRAVSTQTQYHHLTGFKLHLHHQLRPSSTISPTTMSDKDYEAFLESQSSQPASSKPKTSSAPSLQTSGLPLPAPLKNVHEHTYESDSDEPFEAVDIALPKGVGLSAESLGEALGKKVEEVKKSAFDAQGRYDGVVGLVEKAVGEVVYFRAEGKGARVEFYVVGEHEGRVVGVRAVSVES